jgi:hypothetical protein
MMNEKRRETVAFMIESLGTQLCKARNPLCTGERGFCTFFIIFILLMYTQLGILFLVATDTNINAGRGSGGGGCAHLILPQNVRKPLKFMQGEK